MKDECLCDDCDYETCSCNVCESQKTCKDNGSCGMRLDENSNEKPQTTKKDEHNLPQKQYTGITLRDYFAGQALAGIISSGKYKEDGKELVISWAAYSIADAMLAERDKRIDR